MTTWLIDTGPLVAYLHAEDPFHGEVARCLDAFSGRLVASSAVITEAMHLLGARPEEPRRLAELIEAAETSVYDLCAPPELRDAVRLMERYADTPMDFADATLVLLAEGLDALETLTLDRRGFATYRTRGGEGFRLMLDQSS